MIEDAVRIAEDALIKPFEGYHRRLADGGCAAYPDPATHGDPWTIGWGSTGRDVRPDTVWTEAQAQEALRREIAYCASKAIQLSPRLLHTEDRRLAAIVSFMYNCGAGNYRISTLKKRVDAGDWAGACEEILRWDKAAGRKMPGLAKRRQAEAMLLK